VSETEGAPRGVRRVKRGIIGGILVAAAPFLVEFAVCTLVDDILHWKSCNNGKYVCSRT